MDLFIKLLCDIHRGILTETVQVNVYVPHLQDVSLFSSPVLSVQCSVTCIMYKYIQTQLLIELISPE